MSAVELKKRIYDLVDQLDEPFLKVVHSMLNTYVNEKGEEVLGYDLDGSPIKASEAKAEYVNRVDRMKKGQKTNIQDLKEAVI